MKKKYSGSIKPEKKIVKKTSTKPKTVNQKIEEKLEKLGYQEVNVDIDPYDKILNIVYGPRQEKDDDDDYTSEEERDFTLSFECNQYEHCCGMFEIGNIEVINVIHSYPLEIDELEEIIGHGLLAEAISKLIKEVTGRRNEKSQKRNSKYGWSCTLPLKADYLYEVFGVALLLSGFTVAGSFTNKSSGNILTHFILL